MSEQTGKKLKILSTVVFSVMTVLFLVFAFLFFKVNLLFSLLFVVLSLISAVLLIPFVKMADDVCDAAEQKEMMREEKLSFTDMYAPAYIETTVIENAKMAKIDKNGEIEEDDAQTRQMKVDRKSVV